MHVTATPRRPHLMPPRQPVLQPQWLVVVYHYDWQSSIAGSTGAGTGHCVVAARAGRGGSGGPGHNRETRTINMGISARSVVVLGGGRRDHVPVQSTVVTRGTWVQFHYRARLGARRFTDFSSRPGGGQTSMSRWPCCLLVVLAASSGSALLEPAHSGAQARSRQVAWAPAGRRHQARQGTKVTSSGVPPPAAWR